MSRPRITAIIPCFNEEHNMEAVLESVKFADEIMVVDSFSTDKTLEIARKYTNFIIQREYINSASQKNWAIPQANNEWVVLVDADERVTPELREEILKTVNSNPDEVGFWMYRKNHFMGKPINYSGWQGDKVIRLFRKSKCKYEEKHVHAEIIADGKVGFLKNKLYHNTYISFDHHIRKMDKYAWWQANDFDKKTGGIIGFYYLMVKPFHRFFKQYIIQLGFLDGVPGFAIAFIGSYSVTTRYLKIWLLRNKTQ